LAQEDHLELDVVVVDAVVEIEKYFALEEIVQASDEGSHEYLETSVDVLEVACVAAFVAFAAFLLSFPELETELGQQGSYSVLDHSVFLGQHSVDDDRPLETFQPKYLLAFPSKRTLVAVLLFLLLSQTSLIQAVSYDLQIFDLEPLLPS